MLTPALNHCHIGDAAGTLARLADEGVRVQCCVTSPPYYGLRDYGVDGQIGLEGTPEGYVKRLVDVSRGVWNVLADDGLLWINIGDSYNAAGRSGHGSSIGAKQSSNRASANAADLCRPAATGMAGKNLLGIPWRLAFALQDDGWILRDDIIWHKPNPMPESVRDRCTKAYEHVFLLAKSERYFWDYEAMQEPAVRGSCGSRFDQGKTADHLLGRAGRGPRAESTRRNRRNVWTIPTRPYAGAHFAVMPEKLVEWPVLASTSPRGHCPECGARWHRVVEHTKMRLRKTDRNEARGTRTGSSGTMLAPASTRTTGWEPGCGCGLDPVPDVVLDPFFGSGTVGAVTQRLGRDFVGIDLNPAYRTLQEKRVRQTAFAL